MTKSKSYAVLALSILLGAFFLFAGSMKLFSLDKVEPMFVQYGYASWFAIVIATAELLGGLGLFLPRLAAYAAAGLSIIMVGAFFTHATHGELSHGLVPLGVLVLLVFIAYTRLRGARAPWSRRAAPTTGEIGA